jgi:hypothetical protein
MTQTHILSCCIGSANHEITIFPRFSNNTEVTQRFNTFQRNKKPAWIKTKHTYPKHGITSTKHGTCDTTKFPRCVSPCFAMSRLLRSFCQGQTVVPNPSVAPPQCSPHLCKPCPAVLLSCCLRCASPMQKTYHKNTFKKNKWNIYTLCYYNIIYI